MKMKTRFYQILAVSALCLAAAALAIALWSVAPSTAVQALESRQSSRQSASGTTILNSQGVLANTLYVVPAGDGDCSSWLEACDLQTALAMAATGDEIWVAQGLYKPTTTLTDTLATFTLPSGTAVYGGFEGTETSREQRDWVNNLTVLSGDIDNNDLTDSHGVITFTQNITGTNSYHVVSSISLTETAVLDGFTITGGQANGQAFPDTVGGGLINAGTLSIYSLVTVANSSFIGNEAFDGGGIGNGYGLLTITGSTLTGNHAAMGGGGILISYGQAIIVDSTISNNSAEYSGGGIENSLYGSVQITNTILSNNLAVEMGGGILFAGHSGGKINDSTISGNMARLGGGLYNGNPTSISLVGVLFNGNVAGTTGDCFGAGIYNNQGYLNLSKVDFVSNTFSILVGTCYGGGMYNLSSDPILKEVTFKGNGSGFSYTSSYLGGGMYNQDSNPYLEDVLFDGNLAGGGAGMYNSGSSPTLIDVSFENNKNASRFGAGAALQNDASHPVLINVAFVLNSSSAEGSAVGGIANYQSNPTLVNVVFDRNTASSRYGPAAGMYNYASSPTLVNVTFSGNQALDSEAPAAGGIYNSTESQPELSNSILWGVVPTDTSLIIVDETSAITISYSLVAGGCPVGAVCNGLLLDENPLFMNAATGDLRLQSPSPAIDAGNNSLLPTDSFDLDGDGNTSEPLPYDILDMPRTYNEVVDMGAYEYYIAYDMFKVFMPFIKQP
jgi:hypothetical protein